MTDKKTLGRILAHTYATGQFPSHIHSGTYVDALDYCIPNHYSPRKLTDTGLELISSHPVKLGHDWALAHGYILKDRGHKRTSHSVQYYHVDRERRELAVYRDGSASIWTYDEGPPPYKHINMTHVELMARTEP